MCVSNLPRVALDSEAAGIRTRDLLIASPAPYHYATESHTQYELHKQKSKITNEHVALWCIGSVVINKAHL